MGTSLTVDDSNAHWNIRHQQFRETGATATTQRGDPFCVAQSSLDCRATSRYPALPRAISSDRYLTLPTEDLSPFWLDSFVKQGATTINQRGDS